MILTVHMQFMDVHAGTLGTMRPYRKYIQRIEEAERMLLSDPSPTTGFSLVMQPSWKDQADHASAFYLCLVRRPPGQLRSLRDLDQ